MYYMYKILKQDYKKLRQLFYFFIFFLDRDKKNLPAIKGQSYYSKKISRSINLYFKEQATLSFFVVVWNNLSSLFEWI